MRNELLSSKEYKNIFDREMNSGKKIYTQDKTEELIIDDNEKWKQCYKKGDKAREQLPKYWFISDQGNLISVAKGKAYWLKKDESNGRYSYHFVIQTDEETSVKKNIELHNLVRIVFGGLSYGMAEDMLQEQGIFAFGVKNSKEVKLNGHHIGDKADNSPENIELVTTKAHTIIDKVPKDSDPEKMKKFLMEFGEMAQTEEPHKISVLLTGQRLDANTHEVIADDNVRVLYGTNKITLTEQAMKELVHMQTEGKNVWLVNRITEVLLQTYGLEYFTDPKYLCTKDHSFFKCEKIDTELVITRTDDMLELAGKHFIMCYLNKDNYAECVIDGQE